MRYTLLIFGLFIHYISTSQDTYFKVFETQEYSSISQVESIDQRFFISGTTVCNNSECTTISEINSSGDIIWEKLIPWIDVARSSMVLNGDSIFLSGNNIGDGGNSFFFHIMDINTGDSIATHKVFDPNNPKNNMFFLGSTIYNNKLVMTGTGRGSIRNSLIYVIDKTGILDTLIAIEKTNANTSAYTPIVDTDNNLNIVIQKNSSEIEDTKKIITFNSNLDSIWSYETAPDNSSWFNIPVLINYDSNSFLLTNTGGFYAAIHWIEKIDKDKNVLWKFRWPIINSIGRNIKKIKILKNGDIIGVGRYQDFDLEKFDRRIDGSPFIFKLSPEGDLLWERVFIKPDPVQNDIMIKGSLNDILELEDGSLMAVGFWGFPIANRLIVRTSSDGCIEEDCGVLNLITKVEENQFTSFQISPTLVTNNRIFITLEIHEWNDLKYSIKDIHGSTVVSGELNSQHHEIILPLDQNGYYFVTIQNENTILATKKIVFIKN